MTNRYDDNSDAQDDQSDNHNRDGDDDTIKPPYRRWSYEVQRDERRVSPKPGKPPWDKAQQRNGGQNEQRPRQRPSRKRRQLSTEGYKHHNGRSSAATHFLLTDVDNSETWHFEILKSWNDGVRDSDRQEMEGERDKLIWTEEFGKRLELPRWVIQKAKELLNDLGDIRQLGCYNNLYAAAVAALIEAYKRHWIKRNYRHDQYDGSQTWRERDDFRKLWTELGFDEVSMNNAAKTINKKTAV